MMASLLRFCKAVVTAATDCDVAAITSVKLATSTVEFADVKEFCKTAVNFV